MTEEKLTKKLISIVIPVYNEEECIFLIHEKIDKVFRQINYLYEMVFIDDGSLDDSVSKILKLRERKDNIKLIEFSRNFGKESAITAGLDHSCGDAVVIIDADLQDPPELIGNFIKEWLQGADVVAGRRINRDSDSYLKRTTAELFYKINNKISRLQLPENVGDFRLMDRTVVEAFRNMGESQRFMKGLYSWVGFKTVFVDYTRPPRVKGQTKFTVWKLWNFGLEGITSFSTSLLRIWTYIGLFGSFFSILYALYILFRTIIYGVELPGYASLLIFILFLGSSQLVSIGLLGEYIGRIYMESKKRPVYIARKIYTDRKNRSAAK